MTQKSIIIKLLESATDLVPSYDLVKRSTQWGWLGTDGLRAARSLEEEGLIEKTYKGKYVYYKLKHREPQQAKLL